jgi:hypothetical protein
MGSSLTSVLRGERAPVLSDHLCECGCGLPTYLSPKTRASKGWVKGEPRRFRFNHHHNLPRPFRYSSPIGPVELCRCGCGLVARSVGRPWAHRHDGLRAYEVDAGGCWLWQLSIASHGYARIRVGGDYVRAHRWFFVRYVGPIPEGYDLHHVCGVRRCVNPAHLVPMPRDEHNEIHHPAVAA